MDLELQAVERGLSSAAWGYFFVTFDFNLNGVSILPRFVGWLLLYSALEPLSGRRRDLMLLRPLAALLAAWNAGDWLLSWTGRSLDGLLPFFQLVAAAAALYFHFQFLTDMAALAEELQPQGEDLDRALRKSRTAYTLTTTAASLMAWLSRPFPWEGWNWLGFGVTLAGLLAALWVMAALFRLRRCCIPAAGPG